MFITGMDKNTAIKLGDKYVVQLSHTSFEINGAKIGNQTQVVVDNLEDVVQVKITPRKIDHYVDDNGSKYSVVEINNIRTKFQDEDGDDFYPTIQDQIDHLKEIEWVNSLEKVYTEEKVERFPVEIEVIGSLEDTGSDFIETAINYGKASWDNSAGLYKVQMSRIAKDEVIKLQKQYDDIDIPNHSNIEYVKASGKFIFTNDPKQWIKNAQHVQIVTDLDKAKDLEKHVRDYVNKAMMAYIEPVKVTDVYAKDLIGSLRNVHKNISDMRLRKDSQGSKWSVLKTVNEMIEKLRNIEE